MAVLNRTFGCVRLVWNKTLAERSHRYRTEGKSTSYRETDAALTYRNFFAGHPLGVPHARGPASPGQDRRADPLRLVVRSGESVHARSQHGRCRTRVRPPLVRHVHSGHQ
ncbi:helix-turn-helix domain-containing protein [Lentzea sp. BCCO 10_0856]|uniref:Helix-turn-helix domain-containing protein n=1 Tax=Lentzea miocenica TaxID=3095431 RepID=A0ABU4SZV8_9PSEU|nr:helix-turn-helix domain-containing protein [Lentzea sp. BCCO 10_0856]MDX8031444.1 helix-turn-helix domain-containing protein [Lentzea sp. BCCO 10_0856]